MKKLFLYGLAIFGAFSLISNGHQAIKTKYLEMGRSEAVYAQKIRSKRLVDYQLHKYQEKQRKLEQMDKLPRLAYKLRDWINE